jgi:prepilin-type N-terminal cleavage/methylation domain-containing protein
MNKLLRKQEKGFTIIEVLIVLAIAGLIMLIVFLAVPALQRNSRNSQRTNDASRSAAAVNECLNNNNGKVASCSSFTAAKLSDYITIADNQQLTAATAADVNEMYLEFGKKCTSDGTGATGGGGSRSFVITYKVETSTDSAVRCVGS